MDWHLAIEKNREALRGVLAMLVAMVAGGADSATGALPRHLHRFVLRLLRPAEAAARRLIIASSRGLMVELASPRRAKSPPILNRNWLGIAVTLAPGQKLQQSPVRLSARPRSVSLPLLDPLKRIGVRRRCVKPSVMPRISVLDGFDRPRIAATIPPSLTPDDPLDAGRLNRRLEAIAAVLDDLPRHAKRMARWYARRDAVWTRGEARSLTSASGKGRNADDPQSRVRLQRFSPMRPGRPPGWRRKSGHAVDDILKDVHSLAVWALDQPDTS